MMSGTAHYPDDYDFAGGAIPGQIVFNPGQPTVTLVLQAKLDGATEKAEKAKFQLRTGNGYKPTQWKKATITIRKNNS